MTPGPDGLTYVGRVGSGFDGAALDDVQRRLDALAEPTPSLVGVPREDARDAHWVRPELVGEVTYAELTAQVLSPDVEERARTQGFSVDARGPQAFAAFLKGEIDRWAKLIASAKISAE